MIHPLGSSSAPLEQQSRFHEAMKRIFENRCRYDASARGFLQAFHQSRPDPVKPVYRAGLENVVRRAD